MITVDVISLRKPVYIRRATEGSHFALGKAMPQDKSLSWEARGVLTYLLSHSADWRVQPKDLEQGCGRDRVYRILRELCKKGYLERVEIRDDNKRHVETFYNIHEDPLTEKPDTAMPITENTHITTEGILPKKESTLRSNIAPVGAEFSHSVNQADREPEPAVTGDPDPGKKKVASKKKDADAPKPTTELKNAVATLCYGDTDAWKSGANAAAMSKALRDLLSVCPQLAPGSLEAFGKWWLVNDFRGKDGKLPAPHNVAQEWANCKKWHAEHGKSAAASAGPSLTPGYVQDPDFPGISIPIGQLRARRESEIAQKRDAQ